MSEREGPVLPPQVAPRCRAAPQSLGSAAVGAGTVHSERSGGGSRGTVCVGEDRPTGCLERVGLGWVSLFPAELLFKAVNSTCKVSAQIIAWWQEMLETVFLMSNEEGPLVHGTDPEAKKGEMDTRDRSRGNL